MDSLYNFLPYILIGGLMVWMMSRKGGCCGGHDHSDQSGDHAASEKKPGDCCSNDKHQHGKG